MNIRLQSLVKITTKLGQVFIFSTVVLFAVFYSGQQSQAAAPTCSEIQKKVLSAALSRGDTSLAIRVAAMCKAPCESIRNFYVNTSLRGLDNGAYLESQVLSAYEKCLSDSSSGGGPDPDYCPTYDDKMSQNLKQQYLEKGCAARKTLDRMSLGKIEIVGSDLSGAIINNPAFKETTFIGGSFRNAILGSGSLRGGFWDGVDITGLDLSEMPSSGLSGLTTQNLIGEPSSLPTGWKLINGYLVGSGANLAGADFENADLSFVNLSGTYLDGAIFRGADLEDANLSSSVLWNVDFRRANLQGTKFTGAGFSENVSGGIRGKPVSLPLGWVLKSGYLLGENADLRGANLSNVNISGCNLGRALLDGVRGTKIIGKPSKLRQGWKIIAGYLLGPSSNLNSTNLSNLDLSGLNLSRANLSNSNLSNSNLTNTNLSSSILTGLRAVNIQGLPKLPKQWGVNSKNIIGPSAKLTKAVFEGGSIAKVNLSGADLSGAKLSGVNLGTVDLTNAKLTGIESSKLSGQPILPGEWQLVNGYLLGPEAVLPGANLSGLKLTNVNLSKSNLNGANLSAINISSSNLSGAALTKANLAGSTLSDSNFASSKLTKANLTASKLMSLNLDKTDLRTAAMNNIYSEDLQGKFSLPSSWGAVDGVILGPTGSPKVSVSFTNQNIMDIDLSNYDLRKSASGGVIGIPSKLPADWGLYAGYLVGPGSDLRNAELHGLSLAGLNLQDANLTGANLVNSSFKDAKLSGAKLVNADLSGAVFSTADLTSASIVGSKISKTNFTSATLLQLETGGNYWEQISKSNRWEPMLPSDWRFAYTNTLSSTRAFLLGPSVDLADADLSDVSLDLGAVNLDGADLSGATMSRTLICNVEGNPILPEGWVITGTRSCIIGPGARFPDDSLWGLNLEGADLSNSSLEGVWTVGFMGIPSELPRDYILLETCGSVFGKCILGPGVKLPAVNLEGKNLRGINFSGVWISQNSSFAGADLSDSNFSRANIMYSDFSEANLTNANFASAKLTGIDFTNANFSGASFSRTDLSLSNFDFAEMDGVTFQNIGGTGASFRNTLLNATIWSGEWRSPFEEPCRINGGLCTGGFLYDFDFSGAEMSNSSFTSCWLQVRFTSSNLSQSIFIRNALGANAFVNSNLTGATFTLNTGDVPRP